MAHKITKVILGEEVTVFWNHRVITRVEGEETNLYIEEVFYDADGTTIGWTETKGLYGESVDELRQTLAWMLESLDKPVLDEARLLADAEAAKLKGEQDIFPNDHLSLDEVLDSLGLDRSDLGSVVVHAEEPVPESPPVNNNGVVGNVSQVRADPPQVES